MEILAGLIMFALVAGVTLVLPVLSFLRAQRANRIAEDLRERLTMLELHVATLSRPPREATAAPRAAVAPRSVVADVPPAPRAVPPAPSAVPSRPASIPASSAFHEDEDQRPAAPPPPSGPGIEQIIGGSWLLYAGIAAIVLGASYFVKYAFDNRWISEPLRVTAGGLAGLLLVGGGVRFHVRGLRLFGQALAGGGVLILYLSIYAAQQFYALISAAPAFALMAVVTAGAAFLAERLRAQPLAALALVGGFATPLLVGGERGAQVVLFTYIAILIAGSSALAGRHRWPLIGAAAYACTSVLLAIWFITSYEADAWLRTHLFLTLYVVLFGYQLWTVLRAPRRPAAQLATLILGTAPILYHVTSLILLNPHRGPWLIYVVLFTVAGLVVSQRSRSAWLRLAVLLLGAAPALGFVAELRDPAWFTPAIAVVITLYGLHLAAQWEASGADDGVAERFPVEAAHAQLNGLFLGAALYTFFDIHVSSWTAPVSAAVAAWNAALAWIFNRREPRLRLQFVALAATFAAAAVVLAFDGPAVAVGWAAEGVFVAWLAARERSRPLAIGGGLLIALGSVQLLEVLALPRPVYMPPILNAHALGGLVIIALLGWLAWRLRNDPDAEVRGRMRDLTILVANIVGVVLVTSEIRAFFAQRALDTSLDGVATGVVAAGLAEQVSISVSWALYAVTLVAIGIRRAYAPARYFAIVLFAITIIKVMTQDISRLDRLYKMMSVLGVGLLLLLASYLYQKMASAQRETES